MTNKVTELISKNKTAILAVAGCAVLIIGWLIYIYATASSTISVPKAERAEANANVAQQQSITAETQANSIRDQKVEAHAGTVRSRSNLNARKNDYVKVRQNNNTNGVSGANLDVRERQLQSDLEGLYPANR